MLSCLGPQNNVRDALPGVQEPLVPVLSRYFLKLITMVLAFYHASFCPLLISFTQSVHIEFLELNTVTVRRELLLVLPS